MEKKYELDLLLRGKVKEKVKKGKERRRRLLIRVGWLGNGPESVGTHLNPS